MERVYRSMDMTFDFFPFQPVYFFFLKKKWFCMSNEVFEKEYYWFWNSIRFFSKIESHWNLPFMSISIFHKLLSYSSYFPIKKCGFFCLYFFVVVIVLFLFFKCPYALSVWDVPSSFFLLVSKINCSHSKNCVKDEIWNYLHFILNFMILFSFFISCYFFLSMPEQTFI